MVDVYRRLSVEGVSKGLDKVEADLHGVAAAQKEVATASQATATVTEVSSRRMLSAAAAYERLQRSLDPVHQAQQRLAAAERVISRARDQGLTDLSRQNELLALATQRYQALAPAIDTVAAGMSESAMASNRMIAGMSAGTVALGNSVRNVGNQTKQLSFQLFDIAQGIPLAFQSPLYGLQNLAIQTGQVSQLYMGQGGLKQAFADTMGVAKGLGATLVTSLFTPLGQVAVISGVVAAAVGAIFISESRRARAAEDALEKHIDLIGRLKASYEGAAEASERFGAESLRVLQAIDAEARRVAADQLNRQAAELLIPGSGGQGLLGVVAAGQEAHDAVIELNKEGREGQADWKKFGEALVEALNDPDIGRGQRRVIQGMLDIAAAAARTQAKMRAGFSQALPGPMTPQFPTQQDSLIEILEQRAAMERIRRGLEADLVAISARSPGEIGAASRMRGQADATSHDSAAQLQIETDALLAQAEAEFQLEEARRQREQAARDGLETAQMELDLVGKGIAQTVEMQANWEAYADLRREAEDNNVAFDDAQFARLKAINAQMARLAELTARRELSSDLEFERGQFGRSDTEQRVAEEMRAIYGDDFLAHMQDFEAQQIRINERLAEFHEIGRDVTKGLMSDFLDGLQAGSSAFEALGVAAENALNKIQNKLIDMATDQLWESLFGRLAGSLVGGGLSSGSRGLTGAGLFHSGGVAGSASQVRYVHPAYFDDAPRYHRGGLAGNEVPAILERGERVLPRGESGRPTINIQVTNNDVSSNIQQTDDGLSITNTAQDAQAQRRAQRGMQQRPRKSR